ncbi:MAG: sigma-70 family RNA polymerase sigma factor [Deltaproteobacteria bacterium]|nr:sigma-70 family RNA polymerase sigma factor [Deltaproteobacteria bacterium]MBW2071218.1 sigma-70 family RNA polymerase sigma factor [Deltaproteobacteria bacterium]
MAEPGPKALARDEKALVSRCRRGDREAFTRLMQRYERQIYNFVYRMLGNEQEAEDLTQDVFVAAFRGISSFRGASRFSTWLYRIALNQTRNRIKYLSRRQLLRRDYERVNPDNPYSQDSVEQLIDTRPTPEQMAVARNLAWQVQDCLNQLPEQFREILVLRDVQGFSYEELCSMLSLNLGTVKSRLHRARIALQECLATRLG